MATWIGRTFAFWILIAVAAGVPAAWPAQSALQPLRIVKITLTADGTVESGELADRLAVRVGDPLDAARVRESISQLFSTGDFHYVECTRQPVEGGVWLDFRGVLKRYFARFHVHGSRGVRQLENSLVRYFPLGEAYSESRQQRFETDVEKFLQNHGYFAAELNIKTEFEPTGRGVDLTLEIGAGKPSVLHSLELHGEMVFPEERIRKALKLNPGDTYSREGLLEAIERLKRVYVRGRYLAPKILLESLRMAPGTDQVDLVLSIQAGALVELVLEGATIPQGKLETLLPVYHEASLGNDLLEEGRESLQEYFLDQGYSSADISFSVQQDPTAHTTRVAYQVKLGQKLLVENIVSSGLHAIERGEFLRLLYGSGTGIRTGRYFTLRGFEGSAEQILAEYRKRGYPDAVFQRKGITIADTGGVDLEYVLSEGDLCVVSVLAFQGNDGIPSDELSRRVSLKVDAPFSADSLDSDQKALQEFYQSKGFPQARVTVAHKRTDRAVAVNFQVEEGPRLSLQHIAIVGNERTKMSAISRNLGFRGGDDLVIKKLFEGEQKLYNTAAFDQVRIRTSDPQLHETHQTVIVGVRETQRRLLNFAVGFQEFEGPRGLFELSYLNVGGSLRTAQIRLKGSFVNQSVQLNLREPRPLNRNFESFATLLASRKEEVSFTERRFGISLQALRELSKVNTLIFRYGYEHVRVFDVKVAISEIPKESQPLNLSSFSVALVNDTRNNPFDPERGFFNSVNLQVTAPIFSSDARFTKLFAQSQYYHPLVKRLQIAEAFRLGLARSYSSLRTLPISERFFAGGASTLRGFANDEAGPRDAVTNQPIGGNALVINNLEFRFPVVSRFSGVLFYDTGNVFSDVRSIQVSKFTHSVGLGVKIQTPIGPIRFDYGFNLKPVPGLASQHFFVGFGPLF